MSVYLNRNEAFTYDGANRLKTMQDPVGNTTFGYTSGWLSTEDGPWASDLFGMSYTNLLRKGTTLQRPCQGDLTESFIYDKPRRLQTLTSLAGTFGYSFQ